LVLTVHHQGEDLHYPIVVDPYLSDLCWRIISGSNHPGQPDGCQVNEWEEGWGGRYGTDFAGWSYIAGLPSVFAGAAYGPDGYLGAGLYIRDLFVPHTFTPSENGYWVWWAPPGVTIDWTLFRAMSQDNLPASPTCLVAGMTSSTTASGWASSSGLPYINCARSFYNVDNWYCPGGQCNRQGGAYGGRAIVFQAYSGATSYSNYFMQHLGGVVAELHEAHQPYTATSAIPSTPVSPDTVIRFDTVDDGLWLKEVRYSSDDGSWKHLRAGTNVNADHIPTDGTSDVGTCGPLGQLPCPHLIRDDITMTGLSPGTHTIYVDAKDMAGNTRRSSYTVNIITTPQYATSWRYGGADHAVNTSAEFAAVETALKSVDTDDEFNSLWNGLTAIDQAAVSRYMDTEANVFGNPIGPTASIFDSTTASAAAIIPSDPTPANSTDVGSCLARPIGYGRVPPGAPVLGPASRTWAGLKPENDLKPGQERVRTADDGRRAYLIRADMELTPWVRRRLPTQVSMAVRTDENVVYRGNTFPAKEGGNSTTRDATRAKKMPWYYHASVWVYKGRTFYWRGAATWDPIIWTVDNVRFVWYGDIVGSKLLGPGKLWYSCRV
jgi:hypothetical protein